MLMREILEADKPKKTKTKDDAGISNIDDLLRDPPNNPIATSKSDAPEKASDKSSDVPDMPRASARDTARATSNMTPTDTMRDMMSRLNVPDDDDVDLDDEELVPEPITPDTVPAIIRREITATDPNAINPEWHIVANLPGNIQRPIRQLGKALFRAFTRTPVENITMIGNIGGQGPNSRRDVNGVMQWLKDNARKVDTARIDFDQTIPGYSANVQHYTVGGVRFKVVRDQFGEYIYAWPESDSVDGQAQIPGAEQARLNEAGPFDPPAANSNVPPASNVVKFPKTGRAAAYQAATQGTSSVPKVELPKVDPSKVKKFMTLAPIKKLIGTVIKKALPGIGAYYWGGSTWDMAKAGRWRDMFISMAGAGLNIASLFGYAAGGAGGVAISAAEIAAALYVERIALIRAYYEYYGIDTSAYTDDQLFEYADALTGAIAKNVYEELKLAATSAANWVSSQGDAAQPGTPGN